MEHLVTKFLKENNIIDFPEDYISINKINITKGTVVVSGNRLGLIQLADYIVELALSKENRSHTHLDEGNFFENTEDQLIVELDESLTPELT